MEETESVEDLISILREHDVVIIEFYAEWCGPCKLMQPIIEELADEFKQIQFVKANVDKAKDLANVFRIQAVPTLAILIRDGKDITIEFLIGLRDKEEIRTWILNRVET